MRLYVVSKFKLHPGKLDEFIALAADIIAMVRANDPGTISYEWYSSEDQTEYTILEGYESSEAALAHLANIGPKLGQILALGDFSAEVLGTPSPELLKAVEGLSLRVLPSFMQGL